MCQRRGVSDEGRSEQPCAALCLAQEHCWGIWAQALCVLGSGPDAVRPVWPRPGSRSRTDRVSRFRSPPRRYQIHPAVLRLRGRCCGLAGVGEHHVLPPEGRGRAICARCELTSASFRALGRRPCTFTGRLPERVRSVLLDGRYDTAVAAAPVWVHVAIAPGYFILSRAGGRA